VANKSTWSNYFNSRLRDKIGMDGAWFDSGNNSVMLLQPEAWLALAINA
jgi:hypothetical protein